MVLGGLGYGKNNARWVSDRYQMGITRLAGSRLALILSLRYIGLRLGLAWGERLGKGSARLKVGCRAKMKISAE